ncbi:alpha/beta hydrolase-fold protein [Coraliomargarita sp. SDUM461004]|uniref:Alpha/beta hydrolase-fold protein n=1 Tax=Thalassobacterium sedimentorum TaxID=3041258 RepID=A0ABU1AQR9_9BACT|nr:alpha/beta hydrolase-fold protein [Coraliomargarita sp. SDUM461004]
MLHAKADTTNERIRYESFDSEALGKRMAYSVVLPKDYKIDEKPWPVLFIQHGLGRNERSLIEDSDCLEQLLAQDYVIVLPRGEGGWYINSPVNDDKRYGDYMEEIIARSTEQYNLETAPDKRGIAGWSAGAYGSVQYCLQHPGTFDYLATIIGVLDYPREDTPETPLEFAVKTNVFGNDPTIWPEYNPLLRAHELSELTTLVVIGNKAFDRGMNERFVAALEIAGGSVTSQRLPSGHTFTSVQNGLPLVLDFMSRNLTPKIVEQHGASPIDGSVYNWFDAVGTHYRPDPKNRRAGAIRGYPHGDLGLAIFTESEGTDFIGPFTGEQRQLGYANLDKALANVSVDAPWVNTLVWSMSPAKGQPEELNETVKDYQDAAYAHAKYAQAHKTHQIFLQAGNEVNGFFFNPTSIKPTSQKEFYANHYNSDAQAERYVQLGFAPFAEAVLRAQEEMPEDAQKSPLILGSITAATNPNSIEFINTVMRTRINSKFAPSLKGKQTSELVDILAAHYMMNSGPHGLNWRQNLDMLYQDWLKPGTIKGIWLTEEGGTANQGAGDAAVALARFFAWWSDKQWTPLRGRLFFWSDWAASKGLPISYMQLYWGDFFRESDFKDVSMNMTWAGSENLEGHTFATISSAPLHRSIAVLYADDFAPGYKIDPGDCYVATVTQPVKLAKGAPVRTTAYRFDITNGFRRLDDVTAESGHNSIHWKFNQHLIGSTRPVLIFFADATPSVPAGPAFDGPENAEIRGVKQSDGSILIDLQYSTGFSPHVEGGLDSGQPGDDATLVANRRNQFAPEVSVTFNEGLDTSEYVRIRMGLQSGLSKLPRYGSDTETEQATWVAVYWDDHCIYRIDDYNFNQLETVEVVIKDVADRFQAGAHRLRLESSNLFYACQLDALSIEAISCE